MKSLATAAAILVTASSLAARAKADIDPVLVEGQRSQMDTLRRQVVELEDRFYDRYNLLNKVPDFAVHCVREARTATLIRKRSCRAVYADRALQEEGVAALQIRQDLQDQFRSRGNSGLIRMNAGPPLPAQMTLSMRQPEFRKHMREVTASDPELQRLLRERREAAGRYDTLRKQILRAPDDP